MSRESKSKSLFFTDSESRTSFSLFNQFAEHMEFELVKTKLTATEYDFYQSLAMAVKDRLIRKWLRTQQTYREADAKHVYYLSLEFLMGRLMGNALINMGFYDECRDIIMEQDLILEDIMELEYDMGLGNGGLGRLAACFLDSMATMKLPAFGYGIRYEYGIFRQEIKNGHQVEQPDHWLSYGNPWETLRQELTFRVRFNGRVEAIPQGDGTYNYHWQDTEDVLAVAYDIPIPGFKSNTVNSLRLWQAKSTNEFSFKEFDTGNYLAAVEDKNLSENISKVLYPNDSSVQGKVLRLKQEYFFVSASLQDIVRKHLAGHDSMDDFDAKTFVQLNDTHPVIAIPELMRILMDEHNFDWDKAWNITTKTFGYTNHTVVPEALEEWPVSLLEELLPRHMMIIYEINHRFLDEVRRNYSEDAAVIRELSIIREQPNRTVRMANLAIVGSAAVNGVAALHTRILRERIFPHFDRLYPGKFRNVTNGITPRRWLKTANPLLSQAITERLGEKWVTDLSALVGLEKYANESDFQETFNSIKWTNKVLLRQYIERELDVDINLESIFDTQIKRMHLYKRQLLNVFHAITLYNRIKDNPQGDFVPRTIIFSGKAAPAYTAAKLVIKLINSIGSVINKDPDVGNRLRIVFLKNYSVSLAEKIIPATELSEQISTAGLEASGTGNMKFALNGALTIGTMDGANVEIREEVGDENIFIFGLLADEVVQLKADGYQPRAHYEGNAELKRVIDMISNNVFSPHEPGIFSMLIDELLNQDYYCLLADYEGYVQKQDEVSLAYVNRCEWARKAILNVARMGKFSSDRSIRDYNEGIWRANPIEIPGD